MAQTTATVTMRDRGRVVIPMPAREKLDLVGTEDVQLELVIKHDRDGGADA